ncbi:hypothetical protein LCGC14_0141020 [marine sediment metagenome]|uniref:Uncharacterized protein n=1 Tax=marine sediment metagenome TaxID=412755 RepID=A0A0F9XI70_9ZZZZ
MVVNAKINAELNDLLYGDEGRLGYLFPYRDKVPKIKDHIFTDIKQTKEALDRIVLGKMLDVNYIGWTAKALLGLDLLPIQIATLQILWKTPFPMLIACRGGGKTFLLAVYAVLRALLDPGTKVVIVGGGLRQAKLVFNYIETLWNQSSILRNIVGGGKKAGPRQNVDLCYFKLGESIIYALPTGDGTKIRGFRANVVIADEFAAIQEEVFDVVIRGFAATAKTPIEEVKKAAFDKKLAQLDLPADIKKKLITDDGKMHGNQIIYSGTAYYAFNHFSRRHDMWCDIIRSKGNPGRVAKIFDGENNVPDDFNYKDYAVIRIPHTHLPDRFLDHRQLANAKATLPKNLFLMEYGAVFIKDSDGFFPRSLVEQCTVGPNKPIETPDGPVTFSPLMRGRPKLKYVMGIDPAAERDNLAITITEVWPNHYRVVYCWAVNKKEFSDRKERGLITDDDYYAYCCSRIRELVKLFNPVRIEMDSQGGGYAVSEMLRNKKLLDKDKGDFPIYEVVDKDEPKSTDGETDGRHILHLVKQSSEYNQEANICLHKSMETQTLLFPAFDSANMYSALEAEKAAGVSFDTYEENVFNIEELKNELCTIQMSETATGREKFDTPTVVQAGAVEGRVRKGRLRKDRYTALLLSHKYIYETDIAPDDGIDYSDVVGNIEKRSKPGKNEPLYRGPGVGRMRNSQYSRTGGVYKALKRGNIISG